MAQPQFVVVELRVDASTAEPAAAKYSAALDKAEAANNLLVDSANKAQLAITNQSNAMTQAAAANDNLAGGYKVANDNFQQFGKSLADHAIDFLNNVNHLKLLALAAYAMSPAIRSFTNTEISAGIKLVGGNVGLVSSAMATLVSVAAPALSFFASIAIPIAIAVAAYETLRSAIIGVSDALSKAADIAEKAKNTLVTPELFQALTDEGQGLDLKLATLQQAFQATKQTSDTMNGVALATDSVVKTLRDLYQANPALGQGFSLYRDAQNQNDKINAALISIRELEDAGQRIAALDLANKMFGADFANKIRTGDADIGDMVEKLNKASIAAAAGNGLIPDSQVKAAKDLNDRLDQAWRTIDYNMKPSWLALLGIGLAIQNAWVKIIELMAKVSNYIPQPSLQDVNLDVERRTQTILQARLLDPGLTNSQRSGVQAQLDALTQKISQTQTASDLRNSPFFTTVPAPPQDQNKAIQNANFPFGVPLPKPNPLMDLRTETALGQPNAYVTAIKNINDQIDVLKQEADGASKTSEAIKELEVAHTLTAAAVKAGIPITQAMRDAWKSYADQIADLNIKINHTKVLQEETFKGQTMFMSASDAAAASAAHQIDPTNWQAHLKDAGPQMAAFNSELGQARDLSVSFSDTFEQGMLRGESATKAMQSALLNLENQLIQMLNKNLINSIFGGVSGNSGGGAGLGGIFASLFKGGGNTPGTGAPINIVGGAGDLPVPTFGRASGGPFDAGDTFMVGERGPEIVRFNQSGYVSPNGGPSVQINVNVDNQTNSNVAVQQQKNSSGGVDLKILVRQMVNFDAANGYYDKALGARFGIKPAGAAA